MRAQKHLEYVNKTWETSYSYYKWYGVQICWVYEENSHQISGDTLYVNSFIEFFPFKHPQHTPVEDWNIGEYQVDSLIFNTKADFEQYLAKEYPVLTDKEQGNLRIKLLKHRLVPKIEKRDKIQADIDLVQKEIDELTALYG